MQRMLVLAFVACGSAPQPEAEEPAADQSRESSSASQEPEVSAETTPAEEAEGENLAAEEPEIECNVHCMRSIRQDPGCGQWVGEHPLMWTGCPDVCCDSDNPITAREVTLRLLARAVEQENASRTISMLGGRHISPDCVGQEQQPMPNGRLLTTCPSGWVDLGQVRARLRVEITRIADQPEISKAALVLEAEHPGEAWLAAMRAAVREAWVEVMGEIAEVEQTQPDQERFEIAGARLILSAEGGRLLKISQRTPR